MKKKIAVKLVTSFLAGTITATSICMLLYIKVLNPSRFKSLISKYRCILLKDCPRSSKDKSSIIFEESWENYPVGEKNLFNDSTIQGNWGLSTGGHGGESYYKIVDSHSRSGEKSIMFHNKYLPSKEGYRNELQVKSDKTNCEELGSACNLEIGKEYWIGFSVYIPTDYLCDGCSDFSFAEEHLLQIHGRPDNNFSTCDLGEEYRNPLMTLTIRHDNWIAFIRGDSKQVTEYQNYDKETVHTIGKWVNDKGKWTDWVYHFKLSSEDDGWTEIYKNGELVVKNLGANAFNDCYWPGVQLGIYKYSWSQNPTNTDTRTVYFDDIYIESSN
jgi:hypothetical protein